MNGRPIGRAAKRLHDKDQIDTRQTLRRPLYYVSSIVTGVICGFLLGNSWSRQPVMLTYDATALSSAEHSPVTSPATPTLELPALNSAAKVKSEGEAAEASKPAAEVEPRREKDVSRSPSEVIPQRGKDVSSETAKGQSMSLAQGAPAAQDLAIKAQPPAVQEPAKVPPPVTVQEPPAKPFYIVQVGAFSNMDNAVRDVSQLKTKGIKADIVKPGKDDAHGLYRVYIARFQDESRAQVAAVAFRARENRKAYVIRYQPPSSLVNSGQR